MSNKTQNDAVRHQLPERLFHWMMATFVIILAATAFLPIAGVKFDWVPTHWICGIGLTLVILFHIYRVVFVHSIWEMVPGADDAKEAIGTLTGADNKALSPAKYDSFQKGYHLAAALTVLALVITGLLMLPKIDTVFWRRDPSILTDNTWGIIYALHGAGAMALVFLVMLHVYFGLLPEHRTLLSAMWNGNGPKLSRKGTK